MPDYTTAWVGIDPGKSGACALIVSNWRIPDAVFVWDNEGASFRTVSGIVTQISKSSGVPAHKMFAAVEAPTPVPKQGVATVARFYKEIGWWEMALFDAGFQVCRVRPQDWKRSVAFAAHHPSGPIEKSDARRIAAELYPQVDLGRKSDEGRSDALLIAHYLKVSDGKLDFI